MAAWRSCSRVLGELEKTGRPPWIKGIGNLRGMPNQRQRQNFERQIETMAFPPTLPHITGVRADAADRLWILRMGDDSGASRGPIDIVTVDGQYLGTRGDESPGPSLASGPDGIAVFVAPGRKWTFPSSALSDSRSDPVIRPDRAIRPGVWFCLPLLLVAGCAPSAVRSSDRTLFDRDTDVALDVDVRRSMDRNGFTLVDFDYASPDGGRVPALLYEPGAPAAEPAPAILLVHGTPGNRASLHNLAVAYARAGVYVLAISAPWVRPAPYRSWNMIPAPLVNEHDRLELIQLIHDLRQGIDFLAQDRRVDSTRIAVVGHSAGGMAAAILAGVDRRLAACVLMAPTPGWVATMEYNERERPGIPGIERYDTLSAAAKAAWAASLEPLDATHWISRVRGMPILFQGALRDRSVPREDVERLYDAAPEPKSIEWYPLPHRLGRAAFADQARFLADRLGFPVDRFDAPGRM